MVQFYDAVQVHSVTLHSYFSPRSLIGNGRGHERIDKFSVVPAGQKYFPPVFTSFRGLCRPPTVRRAPPPPPPYIFPPSCRAHVGREHVAKEVCAARSARVLDNDGAQHIANHAWRAQQSGLKVVQIRDDDRPGNYQHLRLAIYRKRIYIYIFLLFLSFPFAQVLDYTQYYLNLPEANSGTANWLIEYSLLEYYNLQEITAISLHDLADRFTQFNDYAFVRYVENFPKSLTLSPRSPRCYISLAELHIIGGKETRNESLSTLYRNPCMNARWRENLDHPL